MLSMLVAQVMELPVVRKVISEAPMCECGLRHRIKYNEAGRYAAYCRECGNKKSKERYIKRQLKLKGQIDESKSS